MARIATSIAVALLVLASAAVGQQCNTPSGPFQWPSTVVLPIQQEVPSQPGLNGMRNWQLSLCQPSTAVACPNTVASYITEINGNSDGCDVGFNSMGSFGWNMNYGGVTATIYGSTSPTSSNDRVANITLICDPLAFQPSSLGNVLAAPVSGSSNWLFIMRIATSAVCNLNPSPPGPNPPGPNPPGPNPPGPNPPGPNPPGPNPPPQGGEPTKPDEKSSPVAIVFVVLVFVVPTIYVVATMVFNYVKLGKRGVEMLPHPEFWKDFPVLCLDGCRFVKDKFLQLIGKGGSSAAGTYSNL